MDYYYLDFTGDAQGPIPQDALHELRRNGVISDSTLVVSEGATEWISYQAVHKPSLPALPPLPQSQLPYQVSSVASVYPGTPSTLPSPDVTHRSALHTAVIVFGSFVVLIALALVGFIIWMLVSPVQQAGHPSADSTQSFAASSTPSPQTSSTVTETLEGVSSVSLLSKGDLAPMDDPLPPGMVSHPLSEWYDFGFRQGISAKRVYGWLGNRPEPTRQQLMQLIGNLETEIGSLDTEGVDVAYQGYKDAMEGNQARYAYVPAEGVASLLPKQMSGYHQHRRAASSGSDNDHNAVQHALAATVMVFEGTGHGSGFFFAPGYILTNRHVVEDTKIVDVRITESVVVKGRVVAVAPHIDAAVIKVDYENHAILTLANANTVKVGDEVFAVGYPLNMDVSATVTFGHISNTLRQAGGSPCFQIDLSIYGGNSGGPCVNKAGQVIGINTSGRADADRYNFALRIDYVIDFVRKAVPDVEFTVAGE